MKDKIEKSLNKLREQIKKQGCDFDEFKFQEPPKKKERILPFERKVDEKSQSLLPIVSDFPYSNSSLADKSLKRRPLPKKSS